MFVSDYRIFSHPVTITKPTKSYQETTSKDDTTFLDTLLQSPQNNSLSQKQLPIDYVYNKNYYANSYKFSSSYQQTKEEKNYKTLSLQTKIPQSYSTKIISFYDLVQPKNALHMQQNSFSQDYPVTKTKALQTYLSNDLYFQRTSA